MYIILAEIREENGKLFEYDILCLGKTLSISNGKSTWKTNGYGFAKVGDNYAKWLYLPMLHCQFSKRTARIILQKNRYYIEKWKEWATRNNKTLNIRIEKI